MNIIGNLNPRKYLPPQGDAAVSSDLRAAVGQELGSGTLDGFTDQRVETLQRYYFDHEEFPNFDPASFLGAGWKEMHNDPMVSTREFRLQANKNGDFQDLTLDDYARAVRIVTMDTKPKGMEFEEMWLKADGSVSRNRVSR